MSNQGLSSPEINRKRILEAARSLILNEGMEALSMRKLAQESGLALRTIYNLFGAKENVVLAIFEQGTEGIEKALDDVERAMCEGEWQPSYYIILLRAMEKVFFDNQKLLKPAIQASASLHRMGSGAAHEMHQRRTQKFLNTLNTAVDKELLWGDVDLETAAILMYRNYFSVAALWAEGELSDRDLVVQGRYNILTIIHTFVRDPVRQKKALDLLRELKEQ
ncbi:TetR/AcrR family transcriptional regulator [Desulfatibacillum aliphaticivorans]|uniref:TetR/AcrR family transcriptional regulator n=1 Tax=Desulfatibacillum aliphaticivorans TaxID=218208 RepID=UPI0004203DB9|nr:TetR/AcrR family transcriptional regulator [Desulfatibacillum aliphaticivorans]